MSINIGHLQFDGPFNNPQDIRPEPGIFALVCGDAHGLELLHIDETHCLRDCLQADEYTDNILFYSENCSSGVAAIVYYTPHLAAAERRALKRQLISA